MNNLSLVNFCNGANKFGIRGNNCIILNYLSSDPLRNIWLRSHAKHSTYSLQGYTVSAARVVANGKVRLLEANHLTYEKGDWRTSVRKLTIIYSLKNSLSVTNKDFKKNNTPLPLLPFTYSGCPKNNSIIKGKLTTKSILNSFDDNRASKPTTKRVSNKLGNLILNALLDLTSEPHTSQNNLLNNLTPSKGKISSPRVQNSNTAGVRFETNPEDYVGIVDAGINVNSDLNSSLSKPGPLPIVAEHLASGIADKISMHNRSNNQSYVTNNESNISPGLFLPSLSTVRGEMKQPLKNTKKQLDSLLPDRTSSVKGTNRPTSETKELVKRWHVLPAGDNINQADLMSTSIFKDLLLPEHKRKMLSDTKRIYPNTLPKIGVPSSVTNKRPPANSYVFNTLGGVSHNSNLPQKQGSELIPQASLFRIQPDRVRLVEKLKLSILTASLKKKLTRPMLPTISMTSSSSSFVQPPKLYTSYSKIEEIKLVSIEIASADKIRQWAERTLPNGKVVGEVTNANTLHHKTFKPQKGGLFCERIFGPLKDFECACGKQMRPLFEEKKELPTVHNQLLGIKTPDSKDFLFSSPNSLRVKPESDPYATLPLSGLRSDTVGLLSQAMLLKVTGDPINPYRENSTFSPAVDNAIHMRGMKKVEQNEKKAIRKPVDGFTQTSIPPLYVRKLGPTPTRRLVRSDLGANMQEQKKFCAICDVQYTRSVVRRYQLGYIQLVSPAAHVWYVKSNPSYIAIVLDMKKKHLEHLTYCVETSTLENSINQTYGEGNSHSASFTKPSNGTIESPNESTLNFSKKNAAFNLFSSWKNLMKAHQTLLPGRSHLANTPQGSPSLVEADIIHPLDLKKNKEESTFTINTGLTNLPGRNASGWQPHTPWLRQDSIRAKETTSSFIAPTFNAEKHNISKRKRLTFLESVNALWYKTSKKETGNNKQTSVPLSQGATRQKTRKVWTRFSQSNKNIAQLRCYPTFVRLPSSVNRVYDNRTSRSLCYSMGFGSGLDLAQPQWSRIRKVNSLVPCSFITKVVETRPICKSSSSSSTKQTSFYISRKINADLSHIIKNKKWGGKINVMAYQKYYKEEIKKAYELAAIRVKRIINKVFFIQFKKVESEKKPTLTSQSSERTVNSTPRVFWGTETIREENPPIYTHWLGNFLPLYSQTNFGSAKVKKPLLPSIDLKTYALVSHNYSLNHSCTPDLKAVKHPAASAIAWGSGPAGGESIVPLVKQPFLASAGTSLKLVFFPGGGSLWSNLSFGTDSSFGNKLGTRLSLETGITSSWVEDISALHTLGDSIQIEPIRKPSSRSPGFSVNYKNKLASRNPTWTRYPNLVQINDRHMLRMGLNKTQLYSTKSNPQLFKKIDQLVKKKLQSCQLITTLVVDTFIKTLLLNKGFYSCGSYLGNPEHNPQQGSYTMLPVTLSLAETTRSIIPAPSLGKKGTKLVEVTKSIPTKCSATVGSTTFPSFLLDFSGQGTPKKVEDSQKQFLLRSIDMDYKKQSSNKSPYLFDLQGQERPNSNLPILAQSNLLNIGKILEGLNRRTCKPYKIFYKAYGHSLKNLASIPQGGHRFSPYASCISHPTTAQATYKGSDAVKSSMRLTSYTMLPKIANGQASPNGKVNLFIKNKRGISFGRPLPLFSERSKVTECIRVQGEKHEVTSLFRQTYTTLHASKKEGRDDPNKAAHNTITGQSPEKSVNQLRYVEKATNIFTGDKTIACIKRPGLGVRTGRRGLVSSSRNQYLVKQAQLYRKTVFGVRKKANLKGVILPFLENVKKDKRDFSKTKTTFVSPLTLLINPTVGKRLLSNGYLPTALVSTQVSINGILPDEVLARFNPLQVKACVHGINHNYYKNKNSRHVKKGSLCKPPHVFAAPKLGYYLYSPINPKGVLIVRFPVKHFNLITTPKIVNNVYVFSHRELWPDVKQWQILSLFLGGSSYSNAASLFSQRGNAFSVFEDVPIPSYTYRLPSKACSLTSLNLRGKSPVFKPLFQVPLSDITTEDMIPTTHEKDWLNASIQEKKQDNLILSRNTEKEGVTISGAGLVQKLLKEFNIFELKKMDQQNRILLYQLNKKIAKLKKKVFNKKIKKLLKEWFEKRDFLRRRTKLFRKLYRKDCEASSMILSLLPVLPPDLRPIIKIADQIAASDLNRLYQRVIYRNDRLKKFLKDITTSESYEMKYAQRLLQEAVDNLIQNGKSGVEPEVDSRGRLLKSLSDVLKGKQGRFRQYLLGKRVDYSGRSVIVVGPKLKLHQCGIPKDMALELYLPFLLKRILNEKLAKTVVGAKIFIKTNKSVTWGLLREIMQVGPVLLNRAPTLHRLGFQAFQPKLIEGKAILLHPLVCAAFNADFDGDQMAVHVPITVEARAEAWKLMLARNNVLSAATGEPIAIPSQDMVLGCYFLTTYSNKTSIKHLTGSSHYFSNLKDVLKAYNQQLINVHAVIWVKWDGRVEGPQVIGNPLRQPLPKKELTSGSQISSSQMLSMGSGLTKSKGLGEVASKSNQQVAAAKQLTQTKLGWEDSTLEIRLIPNGKRQEINSEYLKTFDCFGFPINQYIRTTPGRILFNTIIKDAQMLCLPSSKSKKLGYQDATKKTA